MRDDMDLKEKMEAVSYLLQTDGWEVIQEFLTNQQNSDMQILASPKRAYPDDFYRGRVNVIQWLLEALPEQVKGYFQEIDTQAKDGTTPDLSVGHPYADQESQPFMEGEDSK